MINRNFDNDKELENNLIEVKNLYFDPDSPILKSITYDSRIYVLSNFQSTHENIVT